MTQAEVSMAREIRQLRSELKLLKEDHEATKLRLGDFQIRNNERIAELQQAFGRVAKAVSVPPLTVG